jgi:hypothetical protein
VIGQGGTITLTPPGSTSALTLPGVPLATVNEPETVKVPVALGPNSMASLLPAGTCDDTVEKSADMMGAPLTMGVPLVG